MPVTLTPSSALAHVVIDELIRGGVEEFVVAPGSRNAPLSLAVADAAKAGRARLHVRIDERSAAFLALGLAKGSGRASAVVTTSGTATANLHPAVLEASHSDLPLIVLTADRPPELRGTGANQTTDQQRLFGEAVRHFAEIGPAEIIPGQVRYWRSALARALHASATGPVHLNIPLREGEVGEWTESLDGRNDDLPWTTVIDHLPQTFDIGVDLPTRGVVVVAHDTCGLAPSQIEAIAHQLQWPLVAENPLSFPSAIAHASLFLADNAIRGSLAPEMVMVIGRPVLSRSIMALIADAERVVVVDPSSTWSDPTRRAELVLVDLPVVEEQKIDPVWLPMWRTQSKKAATAISAEAGWNEPSALAYFADALSTPARLFVGPSRPIRDIEAFAAPRDGVAVFANRGLAGIDGAVSTAIGVALTSPDPTFAVMGDLTFLHDINGLLVNDHVPSMTFVVIDNNGGGIFSTLPHAGSEHFESVFGTAHQRDLVSIASAFGADSHRISSIDELDVQLSKPVTGVRVLVLAMPDRDSNAALLRSIATRIAG